MKLHTPSILASRFGYSQYSMAFDGTNDKLNNQTDVLLEKMAEVGFKDKGAISVWFQIHSSASGNGLIVNCQVDSNNRIFVQFKNSDGTIKCNYRGDGSTKSLSMSPDVGIKGDGKWHHVLFTWNTDNVASAWFDGNAQAAESTVSTHTFASGKDFDDDGSVVAMGEAETGLTDLYGYVDNVGLMFGNQVASDALAIWNNYGSGLTGPLDLKGWDTVIEYWEFEEGSGATTRGASGNVLEIAGATFSTETP